MFYLCVNFHTDPMIHKHSFYGYLFVLALLCGTSQAFYAQTSPTVKQLEEQRKKALQQIETSNKILNQTKKSQTSSMNKLVIIKRNIKERQDLISSINQEVVVLDDEMQKLSAEKIELQRQLNFMKADYAKIVQQQQINQSFQSKLMFVLSANTFQQTYRRLRYLQEYSDYRKEQAAKIEQVANDIALKNDSLNVYKNRQLNVVRQKTTEAERLAQDQKKENSVYADLKKKEKDLQKDIVAQQKKANELNAKIEKLIAEEIRKAEEKQKAAAAKAAAKAAKSTKTTEKPAATTTAKPSTATASTKPKEANVATTPSVSVLTKEESLTAGNFQKNQGRLPWPTDKGFISGHFGVHAHPVLTHVTTNNKGIYIQTPNGTTARAVFDGVVTQRFSIPGSNNAVIVQHGNYRTVYANLTDIYVSVGQKVTAKQSIGKIFTDDENDNKTELYFQIWQDKNILNPESWLAK
ncbi:MAG: peptidoglycan DD-metalloendopeptidase family protein [Prevotellaceae bacterium]|nr:peptidoglycan DD-metalloendopeptidase family protein [Prevotellaceae bacterium]